MIRFKLEDENISNYVVNPDGSIDVDYINYFMYICI